MNRWKEWGAFIFLGGLAWGTSFMWIKVALRELGPFSVVMYRMLFGAAGAWLIVRQLRVPVRIPRPQLLILLALGPLYSAIPITLITWAELHIDSGLAGLLNGTVPLFTMLVAHFVVSDDRFTLPKTAGLLAGFAGLMVLVSRDFSPAGLTGSIWGQLAVVLASMLYGACNVVLRLRLRDLHPILTAAVILSSAAVTMILLALLIESPLRVPAQPLTWLSVAWMGVIGLSLAYYANFFLINRWGATRSATVTYLIPVSAISLGIIFLGEHPSWHVFAGGALIIGGIALVNLSALRPARPA